MNLTKLIGSFNGSFNFKKFSKASRTDFGILNVAFMVAALDGDCSAREKRCDAGQSPCSSKPSHGCGSLRREGTEHVADIRFSS